MKNDILIIGGGGFLGHALSCRLLANDYSIYRLVRQKVSPQGSADSVHVGDLSNKQLLYGLLEKCPTVFHLASATTPGSSSRQPSLEAELNLKPTLDLLDTLQEFPDHRLIFVSSGGTVYGNPIANPVNETAPNSALSYHGAGKLASEIFLRTFSQVVGTQLTIVRPSNLYGPGQSLRTGFGLIRTMLEHAKRQAPMEIWGDGENIRDFLYIDDMAEACCRILSSDQAVGEVFNVSSAIGHSINQVKHLVEQISGHGLEVIYRPQRAVDVREIVLDNAKIYSMLGWAPVVSLKDGIEKTWNWLKSNPT